MSIKRASKLNVEIVKLEEGESFMGEYLGQNERPWTDKATGEEKLLTQYVFHPITKEGEVLKTERKGVFVDAGLRNAFTSAMVKEGDRVEIVKLEKADLGGGRTVNQYDLYQLSI